MENTSAKKTVQLLLQKEFSFYILTRFLLIFSLFMQSTVLSYLMYKITKNPLSLGLIGLAEVIPAFGFAFIAGYFVDKRIKRNVYLGCTILYMINALFILMCVYFYYQQQLNAHSIEYIIYGVMFLSGSIRAFLGPASFSLLPLLVKQDSITQAVTWSSTSWLLGSVLGPLVGGLLMAYLGVYQTLLVALCGICISFICTINIKPQAVLNIKKEKLLDGLLQGFRFVFNSQIILAVLSLDLFAVLFGGAEALLPVFANDILNVGEVGFGWLRSAHGIGSLILLFVLAYLPLKKNVGIKLLVCVFGFGLSILLFGISTHFLLSFFLLLMAGLFDGVSVVIRQSILQLKTPDEIKGRVSSINMLFISSSNELGAFESGFMARYLGTVPSVVFGGIMTMLIVIFTYFKAPLLKSVKLEK